MTYNAITNIDIPDSIRRKKTRANGISKRAEEIAEQAIALFNIYGASRLSVNKVSDHLGISPGNLHYHFRTNNDLFTSLFNMLNEEIREVMVRTQRPEDFKSLEDVILHQVDVQRCLWRHRYFFRDLDFLIHFDENIFVRFIELQSWAIEQIVAHQEFYRVHFNRPALAPPQTELEIARNCWMMWTSWVRWEAIALGESAPTEAALNQIIHRLTWYHFSHHLPYIRPETGVAVKRKLAKLMAIDE